jgi:hypothetical protein
MRIATTLVFFWVLLIGALSGAHAETLSAGSENLALDSVGRIWHWRTDLIYGKQEDGKFGYYKTAVHTPHVISGEYRFLELDAYYALKQDGTIWTHNSHTCQSPNLSTPVVCSTAIQPFKLSSPTAEILSNSPQRWKTVYIHSSPNNMGINKADDTLWWWGWGANIKTPREYAAIPYESPFKEAAQSPIMIGGGKYTKGTACAIKKSDGSIWCWGGKASNRGTDEVADDNTPVRVKVTGRFTKLSNSPCGLRSDNTVWCWGDNSYGQLGLGKPQKSLTTAEREALFESLTQEERWNHEHGTGSDKFVTDSALIPVQRSGQYSYISTIGNASLDMQGAVWLTGDKGMYKFPNTKNFTEVQSDGNNLLARHHDGSFWQYIKQDRHLSLEEELAANPNAKFTRVDFVTP